MGWGGEKAIGQRVKWNGWDKREEGRGEERKKNKIKTLAKKHK